MTRNDNYTCDETVIAHDIDELAQFLISMSRRFMFAENRYTAIVAVLQQGLITQIDEVFQADAFCPT